MLKTQILKTAWVLLANIFYYPNNNHIAYFYAFGPAVLQKSEKIGQKPVFHKNTNFSLKNAFLAFFFQICLIILKNVCLKYFFILIQPLPTPFRWVLWLKPKISRKAIKILKNAKKA